MSALIFALASSTLLGFADFVAALLVRRFSIASVAFLSQTTGLAFVATLALLGSVAARPFVIGLLAGGVQAFTLIMFYVAVARGTVSVISPLIATSAVIPFLIAIGAGEQPSGYRILGAAFAIAGIILASGPERNQGGLRRSAIGFALAAAATNGIYLYVFGIASKAGDGLSAVLGVRLGSVSLIAIGIGVFWDNVDISREGIVPICLYGLLVASSMILLSFAFEAGLISLVSVLASTFPLVTIGLCTLFLGERLSWVQGAGVLPALVGVMLIAIG